MLTGIKAVIFDVDGTLLDSNEVWKNIDIQFMKERNLPQDDNYQKEIDGMTFHQVAEYTKNKYKLNETPEELMDIWHNMARDAYAENVDAKAGAKAFIEHLTNNNIKLAVATSNSHELIEPGLKRNGIYDCMDYFYTAANIGDAKDDPKLYLNIASAFGVSPSECLVFDDILPVIGTVNEAGMRSCVVLDDRSINIYGEESLKSEADYFIYDFTDIVY